MPGIATGESFSFAEGRLYLYASASGTTSGSGIGFAENATLSISYGWHETQGLDIWQRVMTGQLAKLVIGTLYGDRTLFNLANASAAVHAKFEGQITGGLSRSAQWLLYSGVVDNFTVSQQNGALFRATYDMHATEWSAFGQ